MYCYLVAAYLTWLFRVSGGHWTWNRYKQRAPCSRWDLSKYLGISFTSSMGKTDSCRHSWPKLYLSGWDPIFLNSKNKCLPNMFTRTKFLSFSYSFWNIPVYQYAIGHLMHVYQCYVHWTYIAQHSVCPNFCNFGCRRISTSMINQCTNHAGEHISYALQLTKKELIHSRRFYWTDSIKTN